MAPPDHDAAPGDPAPLVPDRLEVVVPTGGRVLLVSDLHLGSRPDAALERSVTELCHAIAGIGGAGTVVLAGDCWELLAEPHRDPGRALAAYPRFASALREFAAGDGHQVVVLPGNHDGCLGWHERAVRTVEKELGATVAFALDLRICTGQGDRVVRVEHGHALDPGNAFVDPRNPNETPLGHHVVTDLLPMVDRPGLAWLDGVALMADPADAGPFVGSRFVYRRLLPRTALLVVPFAAAGVLALGALAWAPLAGWAWAALVAGTVVAGGLLVGTVLWAALLARSLAAFRSGDLAGGAEPGNDAPRRRARTLVGEGFHGYVTGHTHEPELTDLGGGFYGNTGCGGSVVARRAGRFGLPDAFAVVRATSWLELEAGAGVHARLHLARQETPTTTLTERLLSRRVADTFDEPSEVAEWPDGPAFPRPSNVVVERRRVRRIAAALLVVAGLLDVASAITPPVASRLEELTLLVPLAVPQAAAVLVVLSGIALLLLGRGVRRGQRHAWALALAILLTSFVLHVVKGLDVEEGLVSLVAAGYLVVHRRCFQVRPDLVATRRGLRNLVVGALVAIGAGVAATQLFAGRAGRPPVGQAFQAVAERLVGFHTVALPTRVDEFLRPTLLAATVGLVVAAGWTLFQPVLAARLGAPPPEAEEEARRLVARYGGDTLAYFALRDDKRWWFWGDTLVAYAIHQGVCLVSPDPIGPVAERAEAWARFHQFADDHGWPVAVMAASKGWLPVYRSLGMHDLYVGDEAVVDCRRFSLDGGRNKSLRQAVNRIAKYGYTIEFHDPATVSDDLKQGLLALMRESRRGDVERGFSMTLSRVFDPDDRGLLLAVCRGPDGTPAAFCHYVPASDIDGYSLDLMRRSEGEHPNGLTDFVVVRTIEHVRDQGKRGLGLNFAVMRSVLAGERGDRTTLRVQRWLLARMSDSMQIESLWRFNAKFDPDWVPRYAVYDSPESLVSSAMAVARAESFWELPVIGRFLRPKDGPAAELPALADPLPGEPGCEPEAPPPSEDGSVATPAGDAAGSRS